MISVLGLQFFLSLSSLLFLSLHFDTECAALLQPVPDFSNSVGFLFPTLVFRVTGMINCQSV